MLVILKTNCTTAQKKAIEDYIFSCNGQIVEAPGKTRNVLGIVGIDHTVDREVIASYPGVDQVVPITQPYKLAGRDLHKEDTQMTIPGKKGASMTVGKGSLGIIAGPCTVESRQQIIETAYAVKEAGATALRGGAFKPRTNPYSFRGLKSKGLEYLAEAREETGLPIVTEVLSVEDLPQGLKSKGLEYLAEAREETGLPIVTEVLSVEDLPQVAEIADVVQIGTRNMQNYPLLTAAGRQSKPVLLKRGLAATLDEFLLAAEYIMVEGNRRVILCERGIRTFEGEVRFTLALAAVPLLREKTHLPVIVDPSHGTGKSSIVRPMCRAAIAAGADGLLVEVHPNPEIARIDGAQSITCSEFSTIMKEVSAIADCLGRTKIH